MSSVNALLFGETGVGKSSMINLLAGRRIANTSPDAHLCTLTSGPYNFHVDGREFNILDTPGLEAPEAGAVGSMATIEGFLRLIQRLAQFGGLDLLLFCIRGAHVTASTRSNYRLFYEGLCQSQVPIALVITHLEREPDMEAWWMRNVERLERFGIKASGHACVTGLPAHNRSKESLDSITRMLRGYDGQGRFLMPAHPWSIQFLHSSGLFAPLKNSKKKDLVKVLTKQYKLDLRMAEELAVRLIGVSEPPEVVARPTRWTRSLGFR